MTGFGTFRAAFRILVSQPRTFLEYADRFSGPLDGTKTIHVSEIVVRIQIVFRSYSSAARWTPYQLSSAFARCTGSSSGMLQPQTLICPKQDMSSPKMLWTLKANLHNKHLLQSALRIAIQKRQTISNQSRLKVNINHDATPSPPYRPTVTRSTFLAPSFTIKPSQYNFSPSSPRQSSSSSNLPIPPLEIHCPTISCTNFSFSATALAFTILARTRPPSWRRQEMVSEKTSRLLTWCGRRSE